MRDRQGMEDYINFIEVWEQDKYRDKIQALLSNTVSLCREWVRQSRDLSLQQIKWK